MECQVCALDSVIKAFEVLLRKYSVTVRTKDMNKSGEFTTITQELNSIDTKLVKELSKKKPKQEVITPLQKITERYKDLESIVQEQHNIAKDVCLHCIQAADHETYAQSREIAKDYMAIVEILRGLKTKTSALMSSKKSTVKQMTKLKELSANQGEIISLIKELLPYFQSVCLGCSRTSNDDNLSNHGQTFVSIDAMASVGLTSNSNHPGDRIDDEEKANDSSEHMTLNSGNDDTCTDEAYRSFYADDDSTYKTAQCAHDYLMANAIHDVHEQDEEGNCQIPSHIEDKLRRELAAFADLDVFEQLLCFSQWGGQSFSEFGTMKWVPKEILSPQSKQFVCQRWNKVIEKFPIAAALQKTKPIKSVSSALTKHYAEEAYVAQKLFFDDDSEGEWKGKEAAKKKSKKLF